MNTKFFAWLAAFGAAAIVAPQAHADTAANVFTNGVAAGNADQFSVTGTIPEFIQFTAIDSNLEMGDLGGPKRIGEVVSLKVAGDSSTFAEAIRNNGENGEASIEFGSNTYVQVRSSHSRLRNVGLDVNAAGDDFIMPTQYSRAYYGPYVKRGNAILAGTGTDYVGFGTWSGTVGDGGTFQEVLFGPALRNGMKYRARVTRKGLDDYRGAYTSLINVAYYKF